MLKKEIIYSDVKNSEIIEKNITVFFNSTLKSMKLYEELTEKDFFKEKFQVVNKLMTAVNSDNTISNDKVTLLQADRQINYFFIDYLSCCYLKNIGDIPCIDSFQEAQDSLWLPELLTMEFYFEFLEEILKNNYATNNNSKKKIVN